MSDVDANCLFNESEVNGKNCPTGNHCFMNNQSVVFRLMHNERFNVDFKCRYFKFIPTKLKRDVKRNGTSATTNDSLKYNWMRSLEACHFHAFRKLTSLQLCLIFIKSSYIQNCWHASHVRRIKFIVNAFWTPYCPHHSNTLCI